MPINSQQAVRHYERGQLKAIEAIGWFDDLGERCGAELATLHDLIEQALASLAAAYLPQLAQLSLDEAERLTGYRGRGKNLGASKKTDTTKGQPFKVNVYQDSGNSTCNRAKVDLDRDDRWDVKYTFDGDRILRQVAPADDESYSEKWFWTGESWAEE